MEWETLPSNKEEREKKTGLRADVSPHQLARKEMARETGRARGQGKPDSRLEAVQRAAQAWHRAKEEEGLKKGLLEKEQGSALSCIEIAPVTGRKVEEAKRGEGKQAAADMNWPPLKLPRLAGEGEVKKRRLNSASMSVLVRKAVSMEMRIARGIPRPDPFLVAFEQEAARWRESKEEIRRGIRREIGMLQQLIQLVASDGFFDDGSKGEEWCIGQVSCLVDKVPQDGWNLTVIALERSQFMLRWEWGDLLGIYQTELDDQLNLKNYSRITPGELEEYLRTKN